MKYGCYCIFNGIIVNFAMETTVQYRWRNDGYEVQILQMHRVKIILKITQYAVTIYRINSTCGIHIRDN